MKRISELLPLFTVSTDDLLEIVDVGDVSMASTGTNKSISAQNLANNLTSLSTIISQAVQAELDAKAALKPNEIYDYFSNEHKFVGTHVIDDLINIYGEGNRIEKFTGAFTDPSKFFTQGEVVEYYDAGEDNTYSLNLNSYQSLFAGDTESVVLGSAVQSGSTVVYSLEDDYWVIRINGASGYVLWTASTIVDHPKDVTLWIASEYAPELVSPPIVVMHDNSGFVFSLDAIPSFSLVSPYAYPETYYSAGRFSYHGNYDIINWTCAYDAEGIGDSGIGWYFQGDDYIYFSDSTAVYPWEISDWDLISEPTVPPTEDFLPTRAPEANQTNWTVLKNTVALTAEIAVGGDGGGTVNGVRIEESQSAFVGWVDPLSVPLELDGNASYIQQYSDYLVAENSITLSGYVDAVPQLYALPLAVKPRESSVYLYLSA